MKTTLLTFFMLCSVVVYGQHYLLTNFSESTQLGWQPYGLQHIIDLQGEQHPAMVIFHYNNQAKAHTVKLDADKGYSHFEGNTIISLSVDRSEEALLPGGFSYVVVDKEGRLIKEGRGETAVIRDAGGTKDYKIKKALAILQEKRKGS